ASGFRSKTPGHCPSRPSAVARCRRPSSTYSVWEPFWQRERPPTKYRRSRIWSVVAGSKWRRLWATRFRRARSLVCHCRRSRLATGSCPESTATSRSRSPSLQAGERTRRRALTVRAPRLFSAVEPPSPRGERGKELHGEAPDAAHGRLVDEGELGQGEAWRQVVEDDAHALADGYLALRLSLEVWCHEIADDAEGLVWGGGAPLLVELD